MVSLAGLATDDDGVSQWLGSLPSLSSASSRCPPMHQSKEATVGCQSLFHTVPPSPPSLKSTPGLFTHVVLIAVRYHATNGLVGHAPRLGHYAWYAWPSMASGSLLMTIDVGLPL